MRNTALFSIVFIIMNVAILSVEGNCQGGLSPDTIKSMLIKDWERAKAYTQDYMKAMPAKNYGFKATDSIRTFAQQLLHIAQANKFFITIASGAKPDFTGSELEKSSTAQSADSVMYYVNSSYDAAIDALRKMNATTLGENVTITMDKPYTATKLSWFMKAFEHQTHHRGQTTVYLRLAGVHPPQERLF